MRVNWWDIQGEKISCARESLRKVLCRVFGVCIKWHISGPPHAGIPLAILLPQLDGGALGQ